MQPVERVGGDYGSLVKAILSNNLENITCLLRGEKTGKNCGGKKYFCYIFDISSLNFCGHILINRVKRDI